MRRRIRIFLALLLCLCVSDASMVSSPRHLEPVSSMSVSRSDWSALGPAVDAQAHFYEGVVSAAARSSVTAREPQDGNLRAQRQQELTSDQDAVAQVICSVFVDNCAQAVRVAMCESHLNPEARNRSGALGLFQLLGHGDLFAAHGWDVTVDWDDALKNTVVAHDLWSSSGWSPWVCAA